MEAISGQWLVVCDCDFVLEEVKSSNKIKHTHSHKTMHDDAKCNNTSGEKTLAQGKYKEVALRLVRNKMSETNGRRAK